MSNKIYETRIINIHNMQSNKFLCLGHDMIGLICQYLTQTDILNLRETCNFLYHTVYIKK